MTAGPVEKLKISGARKTAILLTVLGEETAAAIFRDLIRRTHSGWPTSSRAWAQFRSSYPSRLSKSINV